MTWKMLIFLLIFFLFLGKSMKCFPRDNNKIKITHLNIIEITSLLNQIEFYVGKSGQLLGWKWNPGRNESFGVNSGSVYSFYFKLRHNFCAFLSRTHFSLYVVTCSDLPTSDSNHFAYIQ